MAESTFLLRRHTGITCIESSNLSLSASNKEVYVDVAEWLGNGLQIRIMQVQVLSSTP